MARTTSGFFDLCYNILMYKYIRNMLVVATLISTASAMAVLADDSTASPTPKPSVSTQDLRAKAQEVKDNIQAKKDEIQKKKDDLAKQLADKKAEQENKRQENRTKVVNFWSQLGKQ